VCLAGVLYFVNCTINPILYNLLSRNYRQAFKITLCYRCLDDEARQRLRCNTGGSIYFSERTGTVRGDGTPQRDGTLNGSRTMRRTGLKTPTAAGAGAGLDKVGATEAKQTSLTTQTDVSNSVRMQNALEEQCHLSSSFFRGAAPPVNGSSRSNAFDFRIADKRKQRKLMTFSSSCQSTVY